MKSILPPSLLALVVLVASCAPSTPLTRIRDHHAKFRELSLDHQQSVRQGRIAPGMPRDAVFLAWGRPSRIFQGVKDQVDRERWDYTGLKPELVAPINAGYWGRPYGFRGRHGLYDPFFAQDIAYIPYRVASVWFVGNKVEAWEREK